MYVNKRICISLLSFLLVVLFSCQGMSAVPGQISYQGKLTDDSGVPVANGNYSMRFYLFSAATGGSHLWNSPNGEQQSVAVAGGIYNVQLGAVQPLASTIFSGSLAWLEVAILNTTTSTWQTMSPRQQVTSVPFALKAADADTLQGVAPSGFASDTHAHSFPNISGAASDSQIPDDITINHASTAGSADTATSAGNADTVDGEHAVAFADAVHGHSFSQVTSTATDAQIPDNITINHAASSGNADTVDGQHASAFMLSDADKWVNENGDTMSGQLRVETTVIGTGGGESIKGILNSSTAGTGVFGLASGSAAHGVHGAATGASGRGIYGEVTGNNGIAVYGNASGDAGIGIYGIGSMYSGFFDNLVKIGPSSVWITGDERGIYFGDSNFVFIGEKDGDDILTFKAKTFRFENGDIKVEGDDGWNSPDDEAVVGLGTEPGHFYIKAVWGDGLKLGAYAAGDGIVLKQSTGNVGIGITEPTSRLDVNGTTTTKVLKITGGSDIAEPFDINTDIDIKPGMVLTIDADNPGKLKVSERPYDRSVAGIISAAGGVSSGVIMSQTGTITEGQYPVALTGRVYCWADAGNGAIIPGDLLTTSEKPGHAMKVTEYARAQGAVLGKAMTPLQTGSGLVLVLVSLQ